MADSGSTSDNAQASSPHQSPMITETTIPPALKFLISNLKNIVHIHLSSDNYPIWRLQTLKIFSANRFDGHLTGTSKCPPEYIPSTASGIIPNPLYASWSFLDQNLASALCSTITAPILPYILNLSTCHEIWLTLEKRLQPSNRSRVIQLKNELYNVSMRDLSMSQYLNHIKTIVDSISAVGSAIDQEDIIFYILNGLLPSYQSFKTAIRTRSEPISLDELYSLLCSEEINLMTEHLKLTPADTPTVAYTATRGRNSSYRGRGRSYSDNSQSHRSTPPMNRGRGKPTL